MTDFDDLWVKHYGTLPPLAYLLREACVGGWLRVHSLPHMKRYAETKAEVAEVYRRVSEVGDAVLGSGACCQLMVAEAGGERQAAEYRRMRKALNLAPADGFDDPDRDDVVWSAHKAEVNWSSEQFAPLLHAIAEDRIAHVLWIGESGSVFAPYDGGVDAFIRPVAGAERLKARFVDWLSPRPDGL
ncbi:MAG: hypothetical protein DI570_06725 [Phenylobacterium zucineum]|nr:MAG: hypothetical protein DI570_06725 [Phenylobacterium zucineum]